MTAFALPNPSAICHPPSNDDWSMWISADEAAGRIGCTARWMRKQCAEELVRSRLARHAAPPSGGQPRWWVHRSYDMRLMSGDLGDAHMQADLSPYTQKQKRLAYARRDCVELFRERRTAESRPQRAWLNDLLAQLRADFHDVEGFVLSRSSLRRWDKLYQHPRDTMKLIDTRGGDQKTKGDPAAWDCFRHIYLREKGPKVRTAWRMTRDESRVRGWRWPSYVSCLRQLDDRIDPDTQMKIREPAKWRSRNAPYIEQHSERFEANTCWVADHSQLDLFCRYGDGYARPIITTFQDWRTRRIMGWTMAVIPDSTTIMAALKHGLIEARGHWGPPRDVWIDNGRDFAAYIWHGQTKSWPLKHGLVKAGYCDEVMFRGIYKSLGITPHFAGKYNPNGKPRQEKFYGRVHERFCKLFETYTGPTPKDKPERLKHVLKLGTQVPTFDEVFRRFGDFVTGFNADVEHQIDDLIDPGTGQKLSPDQAIEQWVDGVRVFLDPAVMDEMDQCFHQPVAVGRNGVRIRVRGMSIGYGQFDNALKRYKPAGRGNDRKRPRVIVAYNPHDLRYVRIRDPQMRLICVARSNRFGGLPHAVDQDQVKELIAEQRRYAKAEKMVAHKPLRLEIVSTEERLARTARKPTPKPSVLQPIQTAFDGQAEEVQQAMQRIAAGAESMSHAAGLGLVARHGSPVHQTKPTSRYRITPPDAARLSEGAASA
ncbi:MAG: hypothetical protein IT445_00105 [Phycisphaeraceae bacterium]|nr:hypothetical protein [Phycisphaeraceae bacterium]